MLVATTDNEQMAILDACDEKYSVAPIVFHDVGVVAEVLIQEFNQLVAVLSLKVATIMSNDDAIVHGNDIAAQGEVARLHFVADGGCFQRSPTFIDDVEVVAEDSRVGYLRTRQISFGHSNQSAAATLACQQIHIGSMCVLQKGFSPERLYSMVGHAVTQNNDSFHCHLLDICNTHDIGKDTGRSDTGTGTIALNEHGVFFITLGSEHDDVVGTFQVVEGVAFLDFFQ